MRREVKWALGITAGLALLGAFTVPLGGGPRTLSDHGRRILGSDEVHLLREDLGRSGQGAVARARGLAQRAATPPTPPPTARFAPSAPPHPGGASPERARRASNPDPRTLPAPTEHPGPVVAAPRPARGSAPRRTPDAPHPAPGAAPRRSQHRARHHAAPLAPAPTHRVAGSAGVVAPPPAARAPARGESVLQSPPAAAARTHGVAPHR